MLETLWAESPLVANLILVFLCFSLQWVEIGMI